jgi:hypothetical protein
VSGPLDDALGVLGGGGMLGRLSYQINPLQLTQFLPTHLL